MIQFYSPLPTHTVHHLTITTSSHATSDARSIDISAVIISSFVYGFQLAKRFQRPMMNLMTCFMREGLRQGCHYVSFLKRNA